MKKIQDIVKVLPFDQTLKDQLLAEYGTYDEDRKFEIEQIVWRTYDEVRMLMLEENLRVAMQNTDGITPELFQQVKAQTDQQLQQSNETHVTSTNLEQAREELHQLIRGQQSN